MADFHRTHPAEYGCVWNDCSHAQGECKDNCEFCWTEESVAIISKLDARLGIVTNGDVRGKMNGATIY